MFVFLFLYFSTVFITHTDAQTAAFGNTETSAPTSNNFEDLFKAGRYNEALVQLQQHATYDASYFFNLALTHSKKNNTGPAFAYALKAVRLKPHDPEFLSLLRTIKADWLKANPSIDPNPNSTKLELFVDRISEDELLTVIGLLSFVVSLLWARAYFRTRKLKEAAKHPSGWLGAAALIFAYGIFGVYKIGAQYPAAVIVSTQDLYSGPGSQFSKTGSLIAGITVRMKGTGIEIKSSESWQQIRVGGSNSDEWSWIPSSSLLPL